MGVFDDIIGEDTKRGSGLFDDILKPKKESGDVSRGFGEAFQQVPQLGYGLIAGAGAVAEKVLGEGGVSSSIKNTGVEGYQRWGDKVAEGAKESDSWTTSYDRAKEGDFGSLVDWFQHGIGYAAGQGVQILATGGLGALAAKGAGVGASKLAAGMVAKESARIAGTKEGALLSTEALAKEATANVASKIGQNTALAATAFGMEGGEIYGDLVSEATKQGRELSGSDLGKAFVATVGAGGLEFVGDRLGLDLMLGKKVMGIGGAGGRTARAAAGGATGLVTEAGTEYFQTGVEEYGKGKEAIPLPFMQSEESQRHAIDAAALGGLGGTAMGGVGGALSKPSASQPAPKPDATDILAAPDLQGALEATIAANAPTGPFPGSGAATGPGRPSGSGMGPSVPFQSTALTNWENQRETNRTDQTPGFTQEVNNGPIGTETAKILETSHQGASAELSRSMADTGIPGVGGDIGAGVLPAAGDIAPIGGTSVPVRNADARGELAPDVKVQQSPITVPFNGPSGEPVVRTGIPDVRTSTNSATQPTLQRRIVEESSQERGEREFAENYDRVQQDPQAASTKDLYRAVLFADKFIQGMNRKVQRGEEFNADLRNSIIGERDYLKSEWLKRDDRFDKIPHTPLSTNTPAIDNQAPGVVNQTDSNTRTASLDEKIISEKSPHVLDLNKQQTGWKRIEGRNNESLTLVSFDGRHAVDFKSSDTKSGTASVRMNAEAHAFAIDNPYSGAPTPKGELITKPIYTKPATPLPESGAPGAVIQPTAQPVAPSVSANPLNDKPGVKPDMPQQAKELWEMTKAEHLDNLVKASEVNPELPIPGVVQKKGVWKTNDGATKFNSKREAIAYGLESQPNKYLRHKYSVEKAIAQGNPVPANVLADYPDLAAQPANVSTNSEGGKPEGEGGKPVTTHSQQASNLASQQDNETAAEQQSTKEETAPSKEQIIANLLKKLDSKPSLTIPVKKKKYNARNALIAANDRVKSLEALRGCLG